MLPGAKWGDARVVDGSADDEVTKLKQSSGNDIVLWGNISLAQSLMTAGLIDQYQLVVCPVILGDGKPLFNRTGPRDMKSC